MAQQPIILVTDGEQRAALACVRSLGAAGYSVHVAASSPSSLAGSSRYCAREWMVRDPMHDPDGFQHDIASIISQLAVDVLLPVTEASVLALLPVRDALRTNIPFPSIEDFKRVCDKGLVMQTAEHHGIRAPQQIVVQRSDEIPVVAARFPLVIKPSRSVVESGDARTKVSVLYAQDQAELTAALRSLPDQAYPVLLQERIEGPGCAISVLIWDGEVRAAFAHRRLREKPPSGGVSVLRDAIALDHELLGRCSALLADFNWRGVAMVEFKMQRVTGTPYIMEINGRLWGSLQLAIDSGVDFPRMLVSEALGKPAKPVLDYKIGTRTRWEWGDVDHLLTVMRHSRRSLSLPADAPGRLSTLREFITSFFSGAHLEVFRWRDSRPFVRESLMWLRGR